MVKRTPTVTFDPHPWFGVVAELEQAKVLRPEDIHVIQQIVLYLITPINETLIDEMLTSISSCQLAAGYYARTFASRVEELEDQIGADRDSRYLLARTQELKPDGRALSQKDAERAAAAHVGLSEIRRQYRWTSKIAGHFADLQKAVKTQAESLFQRSNNLRQIRRITEEERPGYGTG